MCVIKKQVLCGVLGVALLSLTGCKRYTYVLSPQTQRLAIKEVSREQAQFVEKKDGVELRVCTLPIDAVHGIFGDKRSIVGYAVTVCNHTKTVVELDRAHVGLNLIPNQYLYQRLVPHVSIRIEYLPLGPLFAFASVASFPIWYNILRCSYHSAEVAGFGAIELGGCSLFVLGAVYLAITIADACSEPPSAVTFLSTLVLDRVVIRPRATKTRIFFTAQPVETFTVVLKRADTDQFVSYLVRCSMPVPQSNKEKV